MGFIYKITNKISGKCYIGETKQETPEMRWREHLYSISRDKGCPALGGAINKYGLENFKFEVVIICFDEDRYIYEREYIKKYNSQIPNGYNILPGGLGGAGFLGKKHSKETIEKIVNSGKKFREANPNYFDTYRDKHQESMKKVNLSIAVKESPIYRKAVQEGRIGGRAHINGSPSEETKQKIKESLLKYYKNNNIQNNKINIENHRIIMAKSKGRRISQYSIDDIFIKEYMSISEAGRLSGVNHKNIQRVLQGYTKTAGGYSWRYVNNQTITS
jgi:group I intron endonuclease